MKNLVMSFVVLFAISNAAFAGEAQIVALVERGALWNDRSGECIVKVIPSLVNQSILHPTTVEVRRDQPILIEMKGKRVSTWSDDAVICPHKGQHISGVVQDRGETLFLYDGSAHE